MQLSLLVISVGIQTGLILFHQMFHLLSRDVSVCTPEIQTNVGSFEPSRSPLLDCCKNVLVMMVTDLLCPLSAARQIISRIHFCWSNFCFVCFQYHKFTLKKKKKLSTLKGFHGLPPCMYSISTFHFHLCCFINNNKSPLGQKVRNGFHPE